MTAIADLERDNLSDPSFADLRAAAERGFAIAEALTIAQRLETQGDFDHALSVVNEALVKYPRDAELGHAAARLGKRSREARLTNAIENIQSALSNRKWAVAKEAVEIAKRDFSEEPVLVHFEEAIREREQQSALDQLHRFIQSCVAKGDLGSAKQAMEAAEPQFSATLLWRTLNDDLTRRLDYEKTLDRAEQLRKEGAYAAAEELLRSPGIQDVADARCSALVALINEDRLQSERARTVAAARERADELIKLSEFDAAVEILERVSGRYPDDRLLRHDLETARLRLETAFVNGALARVADLQGRGAWAAAVREAQSAAERYPHNPHLSAAVQRAGEAECTAARQQAIAASAQGIRQGIHTGIWRPHQPRWRRRAARSGLTSSSTSSRARSNGAAESVKLSNSLRSSLLVSIKGISMRRNG